MTVHVQCGERCVVFTLTGITLYDLWGSKYVGSYYECSDAAIILSPRLQLSNQIIAGCGTEILIRWSDVDTVREQAEDPIRGEPGQIDWIDADSRNWQILHCIRNCGNMKM